MSSVPPTGTDLEALLAAGDAVGIRGVFHAGRLNSLRDDLDHETWAQLPSRVDRGDLPWLRATLGPFVDRVGHVSTATALGFEAPRIGADAGDVYAGVGRRRAASAAVGGVASGPVGAGVAGSRAAVPPDDGRRGGWWRWALPAFVVLGLVGALVSRCGGDDATTSGTTAAATTPGTAAPTTVVTAPSTTAAPTTSTVPPTTTPPTTSPPTTAPGSVDLVATATGLGGLTTFLSALDTAQLTATLTGPGPFTVFAPDDAAFSQLEPATFAAITANPDILKKVLTYHVVAGTKLAADLAAGTLTSVEGEPLTIARAGDAPSVNDARVARADVAANNGVLHVIDRVLLPPGLKLGPGDATAKDLVQVLTDAGRFTVLLDLVKTAGLSEVLSGAGPYTVFAPTDDAFAKLPADAVDKLKADKAALTKLLTYHVLPGATRATELALGGAKSVEGDTVDIGRAKGKVTADGAAVVFSDVPANNGYAHVVDTVLVPGDVDLTAILGPRAPVAPAPDFVVFFDTNSAVIRPDAADTIGQAAALVKKGSTVVLIGVADTRGDPQTNVELSDRRANAVAAALRAAGADATFEIRAKGAEVNADLQQARRVEIDLP